MVITELKPYLSNIADKLKSLLGIADKINAQDFAEKIDEVYEKSRLDAWNEITNNNTKVFYTNAFREMPDGSFNPPFAVKPVNAEAMFHSCKQKKITSEQLDLSACGNFPYGFYGTKLEELGVVDLSKNNNNSAVFYASDRLHTIEKIIFAEDGTSKTDAGLFFASTSALANITIGGKIGKNIDFSYSPLTRESIMGENGVANALIDNASTGETRTLKLSTTTKGYLSDSDKATITQKGWTLA